MKRTGLAVTIAVGLFSLGGCGTCSNFKSGETPAIYGGVRTDLGWVAMAVQNPASSPEKANLLGIVDMPFSFIGDTLTLPITLLANRN